MKSSKRFSVLTWSMLGAAILAALGAAAAVARYRYQAVIAADREMGNGEVLADSSGSKAAPVSPDGTQSTDAQAQDQGAETSANGRVTSTGW
jgi:hypothetical protein